MPKQQPTSKDLDTVALANKRGSDADLLLLDKLHQLRDELQAQIDKLTTSSPDFADVFKEIALIQGKQGPKGDKGDSVKGDPGRDGSNGNDGKNGKDGRNGRDGIDGEDGLDGADADISLVLAHFDVFKKEIEQRLTDHETAIKAIPERPTTTIFGPGKTRIVKYDLSTLLDGATKTFQLGTHFGILSVDTDGAPFGAYREGIDYNAVGRTIVFTSNVDAPTALAAGHSLIVKVLR